MKYNLAIAALLLLWLTGCNSETKERKGGDTGPVNVTLIVDFEGESEKLTLENLQIEGQSSVRELLSMAKSQDLLDFQDTLYSGMGYLLLSINGKEPSGRTFWFYCVNGKKGNKAMDSFPLNNGDIVKWTLTDDSDACD